MNLSDLDGYFCSCMFYLNTNFNFTMVLIWPFAITAQHICGEKSI